MIIPGYQVAEEREERKGKIQFKSRIRNAVLCRSSLSNRGLLGFFRNWRTRRCYGIRRLIDATLAANPGFLISLSLSLSLSLWHSFCLVSSSEEYVSCFQHCYYQRSLLFAAEYPRKLSVRLKIISGIDTRTKHPEEI